MISTVLTDDCMNLNVEDGATGAQHLDGFLRSIEGRAYRITMMTVRDADEALDIVQEAMIKLVRRYGKRPSSEWPPLFYRILQNRTRDWHRRQNVRRKVINFFGRDEATNEEVIANAPGPVSDDPLGQLERDAAMASLETALGELPDRQREAFVLRNLEGMDVKQTAVAMGCSDGSVKTHYSRAIQRLRERLGDHWP